MKTLKDIPYGRNNLDLYLPEKLKGPVLIFIHGGAWISGDKSEYTALGANFANQGIACVVMNYKLSPAVRHPSHVEELREAFHWVEKQSIQYGWRADAVFLCGHSAGAHMLAWLGTEPNQKAPFVKGYIGISGIYDIPALNQRWPGYREWFLEKAFGPPGKSWESASPKRRDPRPGSRWLILHGTADELVDDSQSKDFSTHLRARHGSVDLHLMSGLDHYQVLRDLGHARNPLTPLILSFID